MKKTLRTTGLDGTFWTDMRRIFEQFRVKLKTWKTVHASCPGSCSELMSARERFTRRAVIDSPPVQHSLQEQLRVRGLRCKQAEMGAADHSWHSETSTKAEYKRNWIYLKGERYLRTLAPYRLTFPSVDDYLPALRTLAKLDLLLRTYVTYFERSVLISFFCKYSIWKGTISRGLIINDRLKAKKVICFVSWCLFSNAFE